MSGIVFPGSPDINEDYAVGFDNLCELFSQTVCIESDCALEQAAKPSTPSSKDNNFFIITFFITSL